MTDDLFPEREDDNEPVTRGDLRRIVTQLEGKLWRLGLLTVVGNQALNHVDLPTYLGFAGAGGVIAIFAVKAFFGSRS